MLIQNDSLIHEEYWNGWNADSVSNSFSVAKSYVSVLTGIAMKEGKIASLMDPVGMAFLLKIPIVAKGKGSAFLPVILPLTRP